MVGTLERMRRLYGWLFGVVVGFAIAAFYAPALGTARDDALELKPHTIVPHKPIDEMSGIARSRTYEGVYWVHNDSGDRARIFPIRLDGSVIIPPFVSRRDSSNRPEDPSVVYEGIQIEGAANIDWEDIAIDGDTLYIADVGNNANARRDLAVYVVKEPNPEATLRAHALKRILSPIPTRRHSPAASGASTARQCSCFAASSTASPSIARRISWTLPNRARLCIDWTRCTPTA
jgi:hypothetical protein